MNTRFAALSLLLCALPLSCKEAPKLPFSATDGPKSGKTNIPDLPESTSLSSFKANIYEPILQPYCSSCHATTFAGENAAASHESFLKRVGFDRFSGVDQVPVITKLKQSHNCWTGETKVCVETMVQGINLWLLDLDNAGYKPKPAVYPNATQPIAFAAALPSIVNIDTTQYAGAGVDTATLAEPFAKGTDDVDGSIASYAMGKAGTAPIAAVAQAQAAQAITFNVDVKAPGTYQVWARVKTATAAKNNFFARINNANVVFDTPVTGEVWKWVQLTRTQNNVVTPITIQVNAAAVVPVPILFRAAEAKINYIALTQKTTEFDGEQFANRYMDVVVDLPIPGSKIIATVWEKTTEEGKKSLGIKELRIESPKPIHVKTIYPLINGLFHLNHGTYTLVDTIAGGSTDRSKQLVQTGGSTSSTWLADLSKDKLSFAFEVLEEVK